MVLVTERHTLNHTSTLPAAETQSLPGSSTQLPLKRNLSARPPLFVIPSEYSVKPDESPTSLQGGPLSTIIHEPDDPLATVTRQAFIEPKTSSSDTSPTSPTTRHLQRQRMRIHRQLRLIFIYPLVYTLMWLIPFIQHCMMYSDYFAHHLMWFFRIGASICITSMGFVDCLIFSLREKPWRSIQTSDGTLWGSFAVWRSPRLSNAGLVTMSVEGVGGRGMVLEPTLEAGGDWTRIARIKSSVRTSASDD